MVRRAPHLGAALQNAKKIRPEFHAFAVAQIACGTVRTHSPQHGARVQPRSLQHIGRAQKTGIGPEHRSGHGFAGQAQIGQVLGQGGAATAQRPIRQETFDAPLLQSRFQGDKGGGMGRQEVPIAGIGLKPHHAGRSVQPAVQVPGGQFQILTRRCAVGNGHKSLAV